MDKFRVLEIGTYWKEFEVEAPNRDKAIEKASPKENMTREGYECEKWETENLTLKGKVE